MFRILGGKKLPGSQSSRIPGAELVKEFAPDCFRLGSVVKAGRERKEREEGKLSPSRKALFPGVHSARRSLRGPLESTSFCISGAAIQGLTKGTSRATVVTRASRGSPFFLSSA